MNTEDLEPLLMQTITGVGYVNGVLLICTSHGQEWYFKSEGEIEVDTESWSPSLRQQ